MFDPAEYSDIAVAADELGQAASEFGCGSACRSQACYRSKSHDASANVNFEVDGRLMALILIVEDEVFIRQSAEWTMEDLGHETLGAGDLGEALAHLSASPRIDALFVDMRLSRLPLGGYDVANQAVALHPDVRVLYTSGSSLTADMADQFVRGGQFLQKPYSPEQLGACLERLLD